MTTLNITTIGTVTLGILDHMLTTCTTYFTVMLSLIRQSVVILIGIMQSVVAPDYFQLKVKFWPNWFAES